MTPTKHIGTLRAELTPLPARIAALPIFRGYPVPWFVAYPEATANDPYQGEPDFRTADARKWLRAVKESLCWVCGQRLGSRLSFVLGPMCGITRTTSEPPNHHECAVWSVINCPFLSRPQAVYRHDNMPEGAVGPAGEAIDRNPGVSLVWTARDFRVFGDGKGGRLITVGDPERVECFAMGRAATRAEINHSVETGLPFLLAQVEREKESERPAALEELMKRKLCFEALLPAV